MVIRKVTKECLCGYIVSAQNDRVLKMNMDTHIKGDKHKMFLQMKKRIIANYEKNKKTKEMPDL